jgi:uncharacterized protein (TIGR02271 family)
MKEDFNNQENNQQGNQIFEMKHGPVVFPVMEERLEIDKKEIETGKIRINKEVQEEVHNLKMALLEDHINIEKVLINQYVETAPPVRYEGDTTILPVVKEVMVVVKKLMLVEEVHITRTQKETIKHQQETTKKENITITRVGSDPAST